MKLFKYSEDEEEEFVVMKKVFREVIVKNRLPFQFWFVVYTMINGLISWKNGNWKKLWNHNIRIIHDNSILSSLEWFHVL